MARRGPGADARRPGLNRSSRWMLCFSIRLCLLLASLLGPASALNLVARRPLAALSMAAAARAAAPSPASAADGTSLMRRGMTRFEAGDVSGSLKDFDAAKEAEPRLSTLLWQRGLSLYYAGDFDAAAKQFSSDVAQNPNDTEEAIWHYLSVAKARSAAEAANNVLKVGRDRRPVMRSVYAQIASPTAEARESARLVVTDAALNAQSPSDRFYAALSNAASQKGATSESTRPMKRYLGLFAEALGEAQESEAWIRKAVDNKAYAQSGDYMYALAKVHAQKRGYAPAPTRREL